MQALLARAVNPAEFGVFQAILSAGFLFAYFSTLGVPFLFLRILPGRQEKDPKNFPDLSAGIRVGVTGIVFATCLTFIAEYFLNLGQILKIDSEVVYRLIIYCILFGLSYIFSEIQKTQLKMFTANFMVGFGSNIALILLLVFARVFNFQLSLTRIIDYFLCAQFVVLIFGAFNLRKWLVANPSTKSLNLNTTLRQALPFFFNLLLITLLSQLEFWLIYWKAGAETAGYFSQLLRMIQFFALYQTAIVGPLPAIIVPLYNEENIGAVKQIISRIQRNNLLIGLLPMLLYVFFGRDTVQFLFGSISSEQIQGLVFLSVGHWLAIGFGPMGFLNAIIGNIRASNQIMSVFLVAEFLALLVWGESLRLVGLISALTAVTLQLAQYLLLTRVALNIKVTRSPNHIEV